MAAKYPGITHVVHLAAQAGVRHSLTDPYTYVTSNVMGQVILLELARKLSKLEHFVYASSSSVYGGNTKLPFSVDDETEQPNSLYAATKKADELIGHTYAHLYGVPSTGLRFFTVYGPWGRPDMAAFLFTRAILDGRADQRLQSRRDVARLHLCRRHRRRDAGRGRAPADDERRRMRSTISAIIGRRS